MVQFFLSIETFKNSLFLTRTRKAFKMKTYQLCLVAVLLLYMGKWTASFRQEDVHSKSLFEIAHDYMKGQEGLLVLSRLKDSFPSSGQVALTDLVNLLNEEKQDDSSCNLCKAFFTAAKTVAAVSSWEDVRDAVVQVCHTIFNNTEDFVRHDVLCPGAVDIQGPHVFEIAAAKHRKSPEEICTFLNSCLLPKPSGTMGGKLHEQEKSFTKQNSPNKVAKKSRILKQLRSGRFEDRKGSALKVVQLTDIHIEPEYAEGSSTDCGLYVCCDMQYGPGDAGRYGDYSCNIPRRTMELFLKKAADLQPEIILYSGDSPPSTLWDETYHSQVNCSVLLVEAMQRLLQGYRVLPNLGNHEMYPTNLYSVQYLDSYTIPMNEEFTEMWSPLANFSADSEENMRQGGYYSELIRPGLRLLSFNTNYWYTFNWYNVLNAGTAEVQQMLTFMQDTLQTAKANREKVIIQGHHPVGAADTIILYSRLFEHLLSEYSDIIVLHVAGHTHNDEFRVHSGSSGIPLSTMFASPSVSTSTDKNPSMRVFYLDEVTYKLLDFEQHGFMLDQLKEHGGVETGEPQITLIYSAVEEYGLEDMSPDSWRDLIDRMEMEDDLFEIYLNHYYTGHSGATCDAQCRWSHLCRNQFYSYDDILQCLNNFVPIPTTTPQFNRATGLMCGNRCYFVTCVLLLIVIIQYNLSI